MRKFDALAIRFHLPRRPVRIRDGGREELLCPLWGDAAQVAVIPRSAAGNDISTSGPDISNRADSHLILPQRLRKLLNGSTGSALHGNPLQVAVRIEGNACSTLETLGRARAAPADQGVVRKPPCGIADVVGAPEELAEAVADD
ncbi:MAG TPA: hypothetical protein VF619_02280, partial [Allosphingosinicella sp.]